MFTYYTIIGKDLNLLKGHAQNVKEYAGFDRLPYEKEFLVIVYKNSKIPESVTSEILDYCESQDIRTYTYEEPTESFIDNLYACWNLGYSEAKDGWVFRGGSDQIFSKDSFLSLHNHSTRIDDKTILQANTIENIAKLKKIGVPNSRHFMEEFGDDFETFDYKKFELFCAYINEGIEEELLDIEAALKCWNHPTKFHSSLGTIDRTDGCSWLMSKKHFESYGPLPPIENGVTGDVIIHDRFQSAGFKNFVTRDCITYHFVQGESTPI